MLRLLSPPWEGESDLTIGKRYCDTHTHLIDCGIIPVELRSDALTCKERHLEDTQIRLADVAIVE